MFEVDQNVSYQSVLVSLRRVTRVMKGGKRFRFSALVVVGDGQGTVGVALAKAPEALLAVRKAENKAKKQVFKVPIVNDTIPHEVIGENTSSKVLLKPAGKGTGIIASMPVRSVLEKAGYKNILTKSLGSNNHINLVWATIDALKKLKTKEEYNQLLKTKYSEDEFEKYLTKKSVSEQIKKETKEEQEEQKETKEKDYKDTEKGTEGKNTQKNEKQFRKQKYYQKNTSFEKSRKNKTSE